jgi:hypothetical protein
MAAYTLRLCKFNRFNKNGFFGRDTTLGKVFAQILTVEEVLAKIERAAKVAAAQA